MRVRGAAKVNTGVENMHTHLYIHVHKLVAKVARRDGVGLDGGTTCWLDYFGSLKIERKIKQRYTAQTKWKTQAWRGVAGVEG